MPTKVRTCLGCGVVVTVSTGRTHCKPCRNAALRLVRARKNGLEAPLPMDVVSKFERSIERITESGCWIWTGGTNHGRKGYGRFSHYGSRGKRTYAHRFAYETFKGPVPDGLFVCHKCDVPYCVNPDHLFLGTSMDNFLDAQRKGRTVKGERSFNAKLSDEKVREIRRSSLTRRELSDLFDVSYSAIRDVLGNLTWKHIQ